MDLKQKKNDRVKKVKISLLLFFMLILTIFALIQTTQAKYVLNREIPISIKTAEYYFTAVAEQDEYESLNGITAIIDIGNYSKEKYTNVDIEYTIEAINDKYNITIDDETGGVLKGGSIQNGKITINATPKEDVNISSIEKIIVKITTKTPYVETRTIELVIIRGESYYKNTKTLKEYTTLLEAIEDSEDGTQIDVLKNVNEGTTGTVEQNKNITLNLNGRTIKFEGTNNLINKGTLTVIGSGKIVGTQNNTIYNIGTLNVNTDNETSKDNGTGGIIENTAEAHQQHAIKNAGVLNINSGVIINSAKAPTTSSTPYAISSSGETNIRGGVIRSTSSGLLPQFGIIVSGTVNISGGTIEAIGTALYTWNNVNVTITGGTIQNHEAVPAVIFRHTGTLTVKESAKIESPNNIGIYNQGSGTIQIQGGTITGTDVLKNEAEGIIEVKGGNIKATTGTGIINSRNGTIILGENEGEVSTTVPEIQGKTVGISNVNGNFKFYDGVIRGEKAINGQVTETPEGYREVISTENNIQKATLSNMYTVTYNSTENGGTTENITAQVASGGKINLDKTATKPGYTFVGWNTDKDATEKLETLTMQAEDVTLYAIFKKDITITFIDYKGTEKTTTTNKITIYNNNKGSIITPTINEYTNWTARYWTKDTGANVTTNTVASGVEITNITSSTTYYARYYQEVTITFKDYNGTELETRTEKGIRETNSYAITTISNPTIVAPSINIYTGWTARYWTKDTGANATTNTVASGASIANVTASVTYYARYYQEVTVKFIDYKETEKTTRTQKGNRETNSYAITTISNPTIVAPSINTYTNWTERYWTTLTTANATTNAVASGGSITNVSADRTYYARYYKEIALTFIDYKDTEQTTTIKKGNIEANSYNIEENINPTIVAPTINTYDANWKAQYWTTGKETTSIEGKILSGANIANVTTNATYYAVYGQGITLTFKDYSGTTLKTTTKTGTRLRNSYEIDTILNPSITAPIINTYTGWTARYWTTLTTANATTNTLASGAEITNVTANATYYARYYQEITVTFIDYTGTEKTTRTQKGIRETNSFAISTVSNPTIGAPAINTYDDNWKPQYWTTGTGATSTTGKVLAQTNISNVSSNTTYYAVYGEKVTLTFIDYDQREKITRTVNGTRLRNSSAIDTIANPAITAPEINTYTGWKVRYWTRDTGSNVTTNTVNSGASIANVSTNATYYARYYQTVTVTFIDYTGTEKTTRTKTGNRETNSYAIETIANPTITSYAINTYEETWQEEYWTTGTGATSTTGKVASGANIANVSGNSTYYAVYGLDVTVTFIDYKDTTKTTTKKTGTRLRNSYAIDTIANPTITSPTINTYTGWTTRYWTKNTGSNVTTNTVNSGANITNVSANATYYARYYQQIKITFNLNGGSGTAPEELTLNRETNSYAIGTVTNPTVTMPETSSTKTGYNFAGWNLKQDGSGTNYTVGAKQAFTANTTLYAKWTVKTIVVTFMRNHDASDTTKLTQTFTYGVENQAFTAKDWTKTGYTLKGWAHKQDATARNYPVLCAVADEWIDRYSPAVTLYGVWEVNSYTVTYNATQNGGTTTATTANVNYGAPIDLKPTATKDGYTFVGWHTNKDSQVKLDNLNMGTGNVTLYAIFKKDITLTFIDYNGTEKTTRTGKITIYNNNKGTYTAPEINTYTGWTTRYWTTSTSANGGQTVANKGNITNIAANATYYARYYKPITLTFIDYNGTEKTTRTQKGNRETNSYAIETIANPTIASPAINTYTGWKIRYWTKDTDASATANTVNSGANIANVTANATYYARYYQTVTLTFKDYKGTTLTTTTKTGNREINSYAIDTVENARITAPAINAYTGWAARYWTKDTGSNVTTNTVNSGANITNVSANATYYARYYQAITLTFIDYNGTEKTTRTQKGNRETNSYAIDTITNPTIVAPAINTYTGWAARYWTKDTGSNVTTNTVNSEANIANVTANATYYARYYQTVTLTFKDYNGTTLTTRTQKGNRETNSYAIGTITNPTIASPTINTYTGWTTRYWTKDTGSNATTNTVNSGANVANVTANATYYARYYQPIKITYNLNGGTGTAPAQLTVNRETNSYAIGTITNPTVTMPSSTTTKTGYNFGGWNLKTDGSGTNYAVGAKQAFSANTTLYAKWNVKTIVVTFMRNHSASDKEQSTQTFTYGEANQTFSDKGWSKTGYTLDGWALTQNATARNYGVRSGVADGWIDQYSPAVTLYGVWKINSYTVTYNATQNGGTTTATTANVNYGAAINLAPTATKDGYTFVGWHTNKDSHVKLDNLTMGTGNVTLYAIFKKDVTATFNYQKNLSQQVKGTMYNNATTVSITAPGELGTPQGYTFRGWSTKADADAATTLTATGSVALSANATYYASYQMKVTATYYYNSGNTADSYTSNKQSSATADGIRYMNYAGTVKNTNITIPAVVTSTTVGLQKTTYKGLSSTTNAPKAVSSTTATTTYYAYYEVAFTYYYYKDGQHTSTAAQRYSRSNGTNYVCTVSTTPTPSAYDDAAFVGWSYQNTAVAARSPTGTGVTALYAYYQKNVNATFNYHNGTKAATATAGAKRTYISKSGGVTTLDAAITVPAEVAQNRTISNVLYTYRGVSTSNAANAKVAAPTTAATAYYASYSYPISVGFNLNGGTGTAPTTVSGTGYMNYAGTKTGITVTMPSSTTTKTGYNFGGWNLNASGTSTNYAVSAKQAFTANTTLYAKWNAKTLVVTFMRNHSASDTTKVTQTFTYGVANQTFTAKGWTKTGYTLDGWALKQDATARNYTVLSGVSDGWINQYSPAVTIYGVWKINSYTVTYNATQNGGTTTATTANVNYGAAINLAPTATKDGYTFVGWHTNKDSQAKLDNLTMGAGNVTLYAIFKKDITLTFKDYKGTTLTTTTGKITIYNNNKGTYTAPAINTYTGWTARYWTTATSATGAQTVASKGSITNITANTTYYARYYQTVTLTFKDYKGTTLTTTTKTGNRETNSYAIATISNPTIASPAINAYNTSWPAQYWTTGTAANSTTAKATSGANIANVSANATYYAVYGANVTLTFIDYKATTKTTTTKSGTRLRNSYAIDTIYNPTIASPTINTYTGWTARYWTKDTGSNVTTNTVNSAANIANVSANATYYARYYQTVTLTFIDYKETTKTTTKKTGNRETNSYAITTITNPTIASPTINTYTGWTARYWTKDTGSNVTTNTVNSAANIANVSANATYYARYYQTVTLTFIDYKETTKTTTKKTGNRETNSYAITTITNPTIASPTINTYTGWTARYWTKDTGSNATTNTVNSAANIANVSANATYYARYYKQVKITFNANGGSGTVPSALTGNRETNSYAISTIHHPSFTIPSSTLTKLGYNFVSWQDTAANLPLTMQYFANSTNSFSIYSSNNITLYARWEIKKLQFTGTGMKNYTVQTGNLEAEVYCAELSIAIPSGGYTVNATSNAGPTTGQVYFKNSAGTKTTIAQCVSGKTGTGTYNITEAGTLFLVTSSIDLTITATGEKVPLEFNGYTITYNLNEGHMNGPSANQIVAKTQAKIATWTASQIQRSGYTLLGYSTSSSSSTVTYKPGATITLTKNMTLYAVWGNATITFTNGTSASSSCSNGLSGGASSSATIPANCTITFSYDIGGTAGGGQIEVLFNGTEIKRISSGTGTFTYTTTSSGTLELTSGCGSANPSSTPYTSTSGHARVTVTKIVGSDGTEYTLK